MTLLGGHGGVDFLAARGTRGEQPSRIVKIGHIKSGMPSRAAQTFSRHFNNGFARLGYVEGKNLFIEHRYAEGREERVSSARRGAASQFGVDVIFAIGPPQALTAGEGDKDKIPIVFVARWRPGFEIGLVKSLAHPGGNVTVTYLRNRGAGGETRPQWLKEAVSSAKRVAILWNPNNVINKLELKKATETAETARFDTAAFRNPGPRRH